MPNETKRKAWIAAGILAAVALLATVIKAGLQGGPAWETSTALLDAVVSLCVAGWAVCLATGLGFLHHLLTGRSRPRTYVVMLTAAIALILGEAALRMVTFQQASSPSASMQFVSLALSSVSGLVHWFGLFVAALAAVGLVAKVTSLASTRSD